MKKIWITLLMLCPTIISAQIDTKGTEFWLGYMENLTLDFNNSPSFFIEIVAEESGSGLLTAPASPGIEVAFDFIGGEVTKVDLPEGILYALGSEEVENYGFKIITSRAVSVSAVHARWYFSEASMLLPSQVLESSYQVLAIPDINDTAASYSSFVVVATEDSSTVEITPSVLTVGFHGAGAPFTVNMNEGESYQVQAIGDLSGTLINEIGGKKLAVFGGARQADVYCNLFADNHIWDQVYPSQLLGDEYALVPYMGQGISVVKILATMDNTDVSIDGTLVVTLQGGETYKHTLTSPSMLNTSQLVQAALLNPSLGCLTSKLGDPNMTILAPTDFRTYSTKFWHENIFAAGFEKKYFVTLISSEENPNVILDGESIGPDFANIGSSSEYFYVEKELEEGEHEVLSSDGVLGYAYGFSDYDAYTYHLGYQSPSSTSINELRIAPLLVFPNPFYEQFSVQNTTANSVQSIELFSVDGKMLLQQKLLFAMQSISIDMTDYSEGIYFLNYRSNSEMHSVKLIKR